MLPSATATKPRSLETPTDSGKTSINSPTTTTTTTMTTTTVVAPPPSMSTLSLPKDSTDWALKLQTQERTGVPPLHQTIIDKDYDMAALLLDVGANVMTVIQPPLHESDVYPRAAITQDPENAIEVKNNLPMPAFDLVRFNEKKNPDPLSKDDKVDLSAPSDALTMENQKIVNFALYMQAHAPKGNVHFIGANALTLCLLSDAPPAFVEKICEAVIKIRPALINAPDNLGRTPLCIAAARGDVDQVRILLQKDASTDTRDRNGFSPLHHSLSNKHSDITKLLISKGAGAVREESEDGSDALLDMVTEGPQQRISSIRVRKQPDPFVMKMLENRDLDALQLYQAQSDAKRVAVFKALIWHGKKMVDQGSVDQLSEFLEFASPLLKPMRLAKLAVAIARRPGQLKALQMVLQRLGDNPFPKTRLAALRDAAGKSGDPTMLETAISVDPLLTSLIKGEKKPSKADKAKLNRTYALALQVRAENLIKPLRAAGATLDLKDPALKGLPILAILADYGDPKLLRSTIQTHFNPSTRADLQTTELSTRLIKTGTGLFTLVEALGPRLPPRFMHELLCHAVFLNDMDAVQDMVSAGADPKIVENPDVRERFTFDPPSRPTEIAITNANLSMVIELRKLGYRIRFQDIQLARTVSREFAEQLEKEVPRF